MQFQYLNVNTIIIAVIVTLSLYGLVAGKQRLRILILSVYVGIVLAERLTSLAAPSLAFLNLTQVSWLLLGLPIAIFGLAGISFHKSHDKGPFIANLIVGLLTGALITSTALHLLPPSEIASLKSDSFLATNLDQFYLWLLGGLPVVALLLGLLKGKKAAH